VSGVGLQGGIGTDSTWSTDVRAHLAGPYQPCGIIGTGPVIWGAASPIDDEIAFASRAGVVLFSSLTTGKQVTPPFYAGGPVVGVDYSRDGRLIVVAGDTGIQLVNRADRAVVWHKNPFGFGARAAALSPDGTLIAALGWDQMPTPAASGGEQSVSLRLIRVADGASIATLPYPLYALDGVAPQFAPDGTFMVVGEYILSVPALQPLPNPLLTTSGNMALSRDGKMIARGGQVSELATGRELKPTLPVESPPIEWVAFSPDGATYAETLPDSGGAGTMIHRYRTSDWSPIDTTLIDYRPGGNDLATGAFFFSYDGRRVISMLVVSYATADTPIFEVLGTPDFNVQSTVTEPRPFWAGPAVFSPDGTLVATRFTDGTAVLRASDLSRLSRITEESQYYAFLGNGMLDLILPAWVYDPGSGQKVGIGPVWEAISPDGRLAVREAVPQPLIIRLADLSTQSTLDVTSDKLPPLYGGKVYAFSRDDRLLAMVANYVSTPTLIVFDVATGSVVTIVAGGDPIALATTASGATRLAGKIDFDTFRVWSVPEGQVLFDIHGATAVDFSTDGSLIAAGGDGIRIFRADTGALRETFPAHADPLAQRSGVTSVAFSPTGQIASVGMDNTLRFWCSP
jgi:WD40 repeat protein